MFSRPQAPTCTESQTDADCEFAMTNTGRLLMQYLDAQRGIEWEGVA